MCITKFETFPVSVPIHPARAIRGARGAHATSTFVVVTVHTDQEIVGVGEVSCTPIWSGEDHVSAMRMIEAYLAPALIGQDARDIEHITTLMTRALAGNPFTKAGIEMALWDILGKAAGLPVYRLLGGKVREWVPTKFSISGLAPAQSADIAAWAVQQGFRTMKVKVGLEPQEDIARVQAVRRAIGPDIRLGVDANGGWNTNAAIQCIRQMREDGIFFAEQPTSPADMNWLAEVRRSVDVPIIADESVYTAQDALAIARTGAADVLSIYIGKSGGIGPARKIAHIAEAAGLACTVGSNLELGIASAAMAHLALSTSAIAAERYPCDILTPFYYEDDVLVERLPISAGRAAVFERPGLGVEVDWTKVARWRVA